MNTINFKTFAMLFFQESLQDINIQLDELKDMRKFYMKNMQRILHMPEAQIREAFKDIPDMESAYEDYLKIQRGEEVTP